MTREILFRGKREDNGEWVEGGICQTENWTCILAVNDFEGSFYEPPSCELEEYDVIPETVGQYTGLTDKNGTKIFEGDILELESDFRVVVEFGKFLDDDEGFEAYGWYLSTRKWNIGFNGKENEYAIVIGNIHDNPELLEESE